MNQDPREHPVEAGRGAEDRVPSNGWCMCGAPLGHPDDDWVCARCLMERERDKALARAERAEEALREIRAPSKELILAVVQSSFDKHITEPNTVQRKTAENDLRAVADYLDSLASLKEQGP